jgi:gamma-glutamyltranspeptidase / glutathione hydrolase
MRPVLPAIILVLPLFAACLDSVPEGPLAPVFGTGLVSAVHPLVAQAGADALRRGGNAVDAAAAAQWALNVVEPSMSGLGGGNMILLWLNQTQQVVAIDGRELSPAASTPDQFRSPAGGPQPIATAHTRGYAVGVPGTLHAMEFAVRTYGVRPFEASFDPAIHIAEEGFEVDRYLAGYIADSPDKIRSWPASARLVLRDAVCPPESTPLMLAGNAGCAGGRPLTVGDRFSNPDLADTFRLIQRDGIEAFYGGPIGSAIVAAQGAREGRMTIDDLREYKSIQREPIGLEYRDHRVVSFPPPSAGGLTMLEMLGILEPLDLRSKGHNSADALHLMIEAMHLAYQDRFAYIGDSDVVDVPMRGLLSPAFHDERRSLIDPLRANPDPRPGDPWKHEGQPSGDGRAFEPDSSTHTTHFVVVDGWGNIASVTTTIEAVFGTGMVVPGYGFFLNNELTDFDFTPGGPNQVGPHKRPRSSMTPTIVFQGDRPMFALGSPGGATITTTVLQVLLNVLEFKMALPDAVAAPRIFSATYPDVTWESGLDDEVRTELGSRGHRFVDDPGRIGNVQAALWVDGSWQGVADNRAGQGGVEYVSADSVVRS